MEKSDNMQDLMHNKKRFGLSKTKNKTSIKK